MEATGVDNMMESERVRSAAARRAGKTSVIAVVLVLLVAGAAYFTRGFGLLGGAAEAPPASDPAAAGGMPPMPVDVAVVQVGAITDEVRATGHVEAIHMVSLRSDEDGRVLELLFREGQAVVEGAPLVRIDDAVIKAQIVRANADRGLAQQQLDRVRRLRAGDAATPADLERAEAGMKSVEATLALLNLQLERTTVKAPFAGVIGQRFVSPGDYVTNATPLLTIQTVNPQRVVLEVAERYSRDLRAGQNIELSVAAYPGRLFRAQVEFIDPLVRENGRSLVVKANAPNADLALKAGMFVEARLATAVRSKALIVREDAIQPLRTANIVWVVVDGKAARRAVQLGTRSKGVVEILSGVAAGEQVVVGGLERMGEGMAVAPRPVGASPDSSAKAGGSGASGASGAVGAGGSGG